MFSVSDLLIPANESSLQRDLLSEDARGVGQKPLWAPAEAVDVAWELARGGAAVTQGEIVDVSSGAPGRLAMEPWMEAGEADGIDLQHRWRRWSVARNRDEAWDAFAGRAAAAVAAMVHGWAARAEATAAAAGWRWTWRG